MSPQELALIRNELTKEQVDLVKATVAKGASNDELKLFLHNCQRLGLDPFAKQIHFVKYGTGPGSIIVGIDGFRLIASRTGQHSGTKRGAVYNDNGELIGAWAEVYRKDWTQFAREEVPLSEYTTGRGPWLKMPETMIKKVAECAALRMAFPAELSGVYSPEEMDQAKPDFGIHPVQPTAEDGNLELLGYRIPFGTYKQRSLEEVGVDNLRKHVLMIEKRAEKEGVKIDPNGVVADFIKRAEEYIGAFENSPIEGDVE